MGKSNIAEKMKELSLGSESRSAISRIREVFDDIEIALSAGVKREAVWETLRTEGYQIPLKTFESAIYRIRKERGEQQKNTVAKHSVFSTTTVPSASGANPLRKFTGKPKDGDFDPTHKVIFELDNSEKEKT